MNLPILADLGSSAVLRFSELFAGDDVSADQPTARAGKTRQPGRGVAPGACVVCETAFCVCYSSACIIFAWQPKQRLGHADEEVPGEDEAALLHGEGVEALEAEAWASEPEDDETDRAEGGESGEDDAGEDPRRTNDVSRPREEERRREPDEAVVQSAMPAKRTWVKPLVWIDKIS